MMLAAVCVTYISRSNTCCYKPFQAAETLLQLQKIASAAAQEKHSTDDSWKIVVCALHPNTYMRT